MREKKTPIKQVVAEPALAPEPVPEKKESLGRVYPRDYKIFWGPADKGAAKPAFCYPDRIRNLRDEVKSMERNLEMGYITAERKMVYEARLKQRKERLDSIDEHTERSMKIVSDDKDFWAKRRDELAEKISAGMPSRSDVRKRRVNPHKVIKMEKDGFGALKKEYIVISRALGEESNISFLERD